MPAPPQGKKGVDNSSPFAAGTGRAYSDEDADGRGHSATGVFVATETPTRARLKQLTHSANVSQCIETTSFALGTDAQNSTPRSQLLKDMSRIVATGPALAAEPASDSVAASAARDISFSAPAAASFTSPSLLFMSRDSSLGYAGANGTIVGSGDHTSAGRRNASHSFHPMQMPPTSSFFSQRPSVLPRQPETQQLQHEQQQHQQEFSPSLLGPSFSTGSNTRAPVDDSVAVLMENSRVLQSSCPTLPFPNAAVIPSANDPFVSTPPTFSPAAGSLSSSRASKIPIPVSSVVSSVTAPNTSTPTASSKPPLTKAFFSTVETGVTSTSPIVARPLGLSMAHSEIPPDSVYVASSLPNAAEDGHAVVASPRSPAISALAADHTDDEADVQPEPAPVMQEYPQESRRKPSSLSSLISSALGAAHQHVPFVATIASTASSVAAAAATFGHAGTSSNTTRKNAAESSQNVQNMFPNENTSPVKSIDAITLDSSCDAEAEQDVHSFQLCLETTDDAITATSFDLVDTSFGSGDGVVVPQMNEIASIADHAVTDFCHDVDDAIQRDSSPVEGGFFNEARSTVYTTIPADLSAPRLDLSLLPIGRGSGGAASAEAISATPQQTAEARIGGGAEDNSYCEAGSNVFDVSRITGGGERGSGLDASDLGLFDYSASEALYPATPVISSTTADGDARKAGPDGNASVGLLSAGRGPHDKKGAVSDDCVIRGSLGPGTLPAKTQRSSLSNTVRTSSTSEPIQNSDIAVGKGSTGVGPTAAGNQNNDASHKLSGAHVVAAGGGKVGNKKGNGGGSKKQGPATGASSSADTAPSSGGSAGTSHTIGTANRGGGGGDGGGDDEDERHRRNGNPSDSQSGHRAPAASRSPSPAKNADAKARKSKSPGRKKHAAKSEALVQSNEPALSPAVADAVQSTPPAESPLQLEGASDPATQEGGNAEIGVTSDELHGGDAIKRTLGTPDIGAPEAFESEAPTAVPDKALEPKTVLEHLEVDADKGLLEERHSEKREPQPHQDQQQTQQPQIPKPYHRQVKQQQEVQLKHNLHYPQIHQEHPQYQEHNPADVEKSLLATPTKSEALHLPFSAPSPTRTRARVNGHIEKIYDGVESGKTVVRLRSVPEETLEDVQNRLLFEYRQMNRRVHDAMTKAGLEEKEFDERIAAKRREYASVEETMADINRKLAARREELALLKAECAKARAMLADTQLMNQQSQTLVGSSQIVENNHLPLWKKALLAARFFTLSGFLLFLLWTLVVWVFTGRRERSGTNWEVSGEVESGGIFWGVVNYVQMFLLDVFDLVFEYVTGVPVVVARRGAADGVGRGGTSGGAGGGSERMAYGAPSGRAEYWRLPL
ncbi:hypothetical protein HDU83_005826 [Entophlyctis luteolus]|nr:hypothetical protein HDU83_005826 [Entophlyctis luteolus]